VKKEVGKVGEDSPLFILPLDSAENKSNITNFFLKSPKSLAKQKPVKKEVDPLTFEKIQIDEPVHSNTDVPSNLKFESEPGQRESMATAMEIEGKAEMKPQSPVKTPRTPIKKTAQTPIKKSPKKSDSTSKITNYFKLK
jgi:hypothetical protein